MDPEIVWSIAGVIFGSGIGFLFTGYLVKPAILNWEGIASMQKLMFAMVVFLVGSAGGAALSDTFSEAFPWFLIGVGLGIVCGCFHKPVLVESYTFESVSKVVQLSDALQSKIQDAGKRATTILAILAPPTSTKKTTDELGSVLDESLDDIVEGDVEAEEEETGDEE